MLDHLQIYDRRDRTIVGAADAALTVAGPLFRLGRPRPAAKPRRILLLRLERIGDLLMSLDAIGDVVRAAPGAEIDLVVGSWNAELARRIGGIHRLETIDASWLSRESEGLALTSMLRLARSWSARKYDLGINFEPDIRSNMILAAARPARSAGFISGGGGSLLDVRLPYHAGEHTAVNAERLVAAVLDVPPRARTGRLHIPADERRRAAERLGARRRPLVGVHVNGGRAIKQWSPDRFAELASRLAAARGATIVLTGAASDHELVEPVRRTLSDMNVLDLVGSLDLPSLAAALEQLDVFVTGDTGPMHLAAAVATPVVAIFGPSDPARYAPRDPIHRIVRIDLPCSPCNRIRLPPERCVGHIPDCLAGIDVEMVYRAVETVLDGARQSAAHPAIARPASPKLKAKAGG
jgi:lipopolysaccharide heptosyltransferase II